MINEAKKFIEKRDDSKAIAMEIFKEIIELDNVKIITLTSDIMINYHKRKIRAIKPSMGKHKKDADAIIIESLLYYLKDKQEGSLIFCSNNTSDFANNANDSLHEEIRDDFNIKTKLYKSLYNLLEEEFEQKINNEEIEDIKEIEEESKKTNKDLNLSSKNKKILEEISKTKIGEEFISKMIEENDRFNKSSIKKFSGMRSEIAEEIRREMNKENNKILKRPMQQFYEMNSEMKEEIIKKVIENNNKILKSPIQRFLESLTDSYENGDFDS